MSSHAKRAPRRRSQRLRALLGLGVLLGVGATGTFAYWTDDVAITGTTFTAGSIDLQVNNLETYASATLSMSLTPMVPGNTSAEVLPVKNSGTAPLKYTLTGGLAGTDAAAYAASTGWLKLTILAGGTRSGSGNAATCTGGTNIFGPTSLTATVGTPIIATRRGPLAALGGTESLCFQITLDASAPSSLQGKTATASFTFTGTSDVS